MLIEKELVKALEPIFEVLHSLQRQLDNIQLTPGPKGEKGEPPNLELLAKAMAEAYGSILRGEKGDPGKDGVAPTVEEIKTSLLSSADFLSMVKGEKGDPGQNSDLDAICATLIEKHIDKIRGPKGDAAEAIEINLDDVRDTLIKSKEFIDLIKAPAPDVSEVAKAIFAEFKEALKGEPGKDADHSKIAAELKEDAAFVKSLVGEKGEKGETGPAGPAGSGIGSIRWQKGVYRSGTTVQHFLGHYYCAKRDTADEPGTSEDWVRMGSNGFRILEKALPADQMLDGDIYPMRGGSCIWYDGKAHRLTEPGPAGLPGVNGAPGESGKNAPHFVAGEISGNSLVLALSDGTLLDCEIKNFGAKSELVARDICALMLEEERKAMESRGVPLRVHRGVWRESSKYQFGDVVEFGGGAWVCKSRNASTRFSDTDWQRIVTFPAAKKQRHSQPKSISRIPAKKAAGQNLRGEIEALDEGELNLLEIQTWSARDGFTPAIRFATFDPSMLVNVANLNYSSIQLNNFTKQCFGAIDKGALFVDGEFPLCDGVLKPDSKLIAQVSIDKRNPDFDMVSVESRYLCINGDMIGYNVNFWTNKEHAISFIGFGQASDASESHWRVFRK